MRPLHYVFALLFFAMVSCQKDDEAITGAPGEQTFTPGVVITLDDDYVDNWVTAHDILSEHQWKATFFITKCNQLSPGKISRLQEFKQYGHEIGGHGLNHLNAPQLVAAGGATGYLSREIFPMVSFMDALSLHTTSFAYPFGARNATTDDILLNEFEILRGTTYGRPDAQYQNCYYTGRRVVYALGLDNSYPHFSVPYFISLLQYAKNNNKIVVFYAHRTVQTAQNDYETEYNTLIQICRFVNNNNMKFYTMSELIDLPL
jgi:peptidoglycan/xylan/chitin deacetylase (PgdA/CDA1 family)